MDSKKRQAIVLIHGIGEQRPMDTLRSFVAGLGEKKYYNKPDRLSDSLELRRYTLPSNSNRPITDCYELYWAHHFESGKILETLRWAARLITRQFFWRLDKTLRGVVGMIQIAGALLASIVGVLIARLVGSEALAATELYWLVGISGALLLGVLGSGWFITGSLADAARYLTPHPRNVAARNRIRADGLTLLKKLHEDGDYDRVVLVGHSLGSVIGIDLIRLAWDELRHPNPALLNDSNFRVKQTEAKAFDKCATALDGSSGAKDLADFQQRQHRLWCENRALGVPWLVTDFVTLGSPLAHASLLLDTRSVKLKQRQREGEYPQCPPLAERSTTFVDIKYQINEQFSTLKVGKHDASFGPTRWTNLYFPVRFASLGDPVGGPIASEFGPGVRDIPVRLSLGGWRATIYKLLLKPHTHYWSCDPGRPSADRARRKQLDDVTGTRDANTMLLDALKL
ncbi:hypothetical protein GCM10009715_22390 [Paeniglutamicibacter psychrophenolicus]|uniref:Uncharacterized membrane protein YuzA (DUF378 family) n=1 Tax=Paeniglutamicibacter psychrophenolicus TaxID=257454 RepID=A0ABS4WHJ4_9MICC|nr:hypothetical protein [Paeniglutamicibacter psychrophenolicus]MBP2375674.1 uncharacterized membrane protein YuzA (DUF378 family) [Paeniglutamicibacter psychrophenolicus]